MKFGTYLTRKFSFKGGKVIFIDYYINMYGNGLYVKNKKTNRTAEVYPNANKSGKYGVRLQEYYYNSNGNPRWVGGNYIGSSYSYEEARKLALDFVIKNKIPNRFTFGR